MQVILL